MAKREESSIIIGSTCYQNISNYFPNPKEVNVVINRQEAEGSIADANDCLRSVKGRLNWFHQKQQFCSHLISMEDSNQVQYLIDRVVAEELPILEFQQKLKLGLVANVSRDLEIRVSAVCDRFCEMKKLLELLYNDIELVIQTQKFVSI